MEGGKLFQMTDAAIRFSENNFMFETNRGQNDVYQDCKIISV